LLFTEENVRLDKYLKVSRIIKRRTVANDACDAEHVTVNGRRAKASYDVKVGDVLEVTFGQRTLKLRVKEVKDSVAKADASAMYEIIE
jgi:ribosomal 50S subunit-recycling heat shock protein